MNLENLDAGNVIIIINGFSMQCVLFFIKDQSEKRFIESNIEQSLIKSEVHGNIYM